MAMFMEHMDTITDGLTLCNFKWQRSYRCHFINGSILHNANYANNKMS